MRRVQNLALGCEPYLPPPGRLVRQVRDRGRGHVIDLDEGAARRQLGELDAIDGARLAAELHLLEGGEVVALGELALHEARLEVLHQRVDARWADGAH